MSVFHKVQSPNETIETIIRSTPELYLMCNTGKTVNDFNSLDIVKCTYLKGFLKVKSLENNKIIVDSIPYEEPLILNKISPEFLSKVDVDQNTIELLYAKVN